ncbi:glycosyltransferase family 4 protein [Cytobacillus firmus]|uniref:glycosyltransferase family 4 protein n=1 Tax=Cytobacillus firmus TaxID=1399 RepID=UPI0030037177
MIMKKILFTATVSQGHIKAFHIPYLKWFKEKGYEVHVAAKGEDDIPYCDKFFNIPFNRSPLNFSNFKAYKQLKNIIQNNDYDLIHCHTPMGSVLTRIAAKKAREKGTKVVYTAHGFHFFEGAPIKNWILYYPVERWLSRYTDCLITINEEDYNRVKDTFKALDIRLVNGVGIDLEKFSSQTNDEKSKLKKEYGYVQDDFLIIYAGELSYRKHQDLIIKAVGKLKDNYPNIKVLLAGKGQLEAQYKEMVARLGLNKNIHFLGFRRDISKLMALSDIAVSSSRQEGLPVNIMEAMATGLPLVVTDCRGNRDLVKNNENGYVVPINNEEKFAEAITKLYKSVKIRNNFSLKGLEYVERFSLEKITREMEKIYMELL